VAPTVQGLFANEEHDKVWLQPKLSAHSKANATSTFVRCKFLYCMDKKLNEMKNFLALLAFAVIMAGRPLPWPPHRWIAIFLVNYFLQQAAAVQTSWVAFAPFDLGPAGPCVPSGAASLLQIAEPLNGNNLAAGACVNYFVSYRNLTASGVCDSNR
jgi:hypothetical protein